MAHPKPAECPTLGGQQPQVEQTQPPFLAFQMPKMEMTQLQPRLRHQPAYKPPQQQPQFVVFEVATTSYASAASSASTASFDETTGSSSTALSTLFGQGSSQMAATSYRALTVPFLPIANSAAVFQQRMADDGEEESEPFTGEIHFSTVQFILPKPSVGKKTQNRQSSSSSSSSSRLLFDNPMFRRLPNWHFFGDDRRLAQVPPFIPLFVPVERTLLSIAPSLSGIRQLVLMGMLDIKAMTTTTVHQQPDALEYNKLEDTEEEDILITSATRRCWPEESRVTTPAEEDADCISAICRAQTPTTDLAAALDEVESTTELNSNTESGCFSLETTSTTTTEATVTTASSSSVNSSAPNSPPTFDRRTVRMSRSARDAMFRLSISRRFEEEEAEQTCNNSRSSVKSGEDDSTDEQRMSLRSRHISNDSSIDNAYMQPNQAALHHHQHLLYQQQQQQPQQPFIQSKPPISIHGISCMDVLSERIYNLHQNVQQSYFHLNRKLILRDQLYYTISPVFPLCGLYIVGSSLNGFGTSNSDLDLCLMISNRDIDQRKDAVVILSSVMRILESSKMVVSLQLILAKVPILRIKCAGVFSDIMVDLNVNNSVAVRNTHLMCYYSAFDWRVRPIVMVVKEWAKRRGINNSSRSSFTSYSLVLMVIHYLQCGTNPPVLPSLQQLYPNRFSDTNDIRNLNVSQNLEPIPSTIWQFNQRLSLSELLLGFLHYYAYEFNFDIDAISIRAGMRVPRAQVAQNKSAYNTLSQWHCICIEEPFTLTNAAHSVYDQRIFEEIKKQFADSYQDLDKYRDLDSFLGEPSEESVPLEQAMLAVEPNDGGEKENEDAATVDAAMANGNSA